MMTLYTYKTIVDDIERNILSLINPDNAFSKGLLSKNIIGFFKQIDNAVQPDNIVYNPNFIKLFHRTIKSTSLKSDDLQKSAWRQNTGFIYIIDQRTKDKVDTKPQDILGSFEIIEGKIQADSYQANPNYQIISADGLFNLPENFEKDLLTALTT